MDRGKFLPKAAQVDRLSYCAKIARGKKVLHIGMGGMVDDAEKTRTYLASDLTNTLHARLAQTARDLLGLDINPEAIEIMRRAVPGRYLVADIAGPLDLDETFDVVMFPEVIEHLDCFRAALQNIRNLLEREGVMVLTTANAYSADRIIKMLLRYESVHLEHTCYFSYFTLKRLLAMNGFSLETFAYTGRGNAPYSSVGQRVVGTIESLFGRLMPQFSGGLLALAKPI